MEEQKRLIEDTEAQVADMRVVKVGVVDCTSFRFRAGLAGAGRVKYMAHSTVLVLFSYSASLELLMLTHPCASHMAPTAKEGGQWWQGRKPGEEAREEPHCRFQMEEARPQQSGLSICVLNVWPALRIAGGQRFAADYP